VLGRTQDGAFLLGPGAYEGIFQSYCLHAGTYGPSKGGGYCPAPLLGPKADMVRAILKESVFHPEIPQRDIQVLLWAILARADYQHMPPEMERTASALLSPVLLEQLKGGPLSRLPDSLRQPLERKLQQQIATLSAPIQRVLKAESDIRQQVNRSASYEAIERIAVLAGLLPEDPAAATIPRGIWIQHPQGYYVRYLPESYSRTKIQVFVPDNAAANENLFKNVAYTGRDIKQVLVFDPAEEIAAPANTGAQRLALTSRQRDGADLPEPVNVTLSLRAFIPCEAVRIEGSLGAVGGLYFGDGYRGDTHRALQRIAFKWNGDGTVIVNNKFLGWGQSRLYRLDQGISAGIAPAPWCYSLPKEQWSYPWVVAREERRDDNNQITIDDTSNPGIVVVTFLLNGKNPVSQFSRFLTPNLSALLRVELRRKAETVEYKILGSHDGFPAYDLMLDDQRVYCWDPLTVWTSHFDGHTSTLGSPFDLGEQKGIHISTVWHYIGGPLEDSQKRCIAQ
jgi:hypothetical protein